MSNKATIETSTLLTSPHGFSTRLGGVSKDIFQSLNLGMNRGDDQTAVTENWRLFMEKCGIGYRPFVCGKQVHGNTVHMASLKDARPAFGKGELIEADGYVTNIPNLPLAIFTADCVPVLFEDPIHKVVGAVHCGWRSAVADIEKKAIKKAIKLGADPTCIRIAIGPSIERCCFEVGPEVVEEAAKLIGNNAYTNYADKVPNTNPQKYMLDLKGVVRQRFIDLGILEENIEMVGTCTMCHPDRYYSHRYSNGARGSLACCIMIKE